MEIYIIKQFRFDDECIFGNISFGNVGFFNYFDRAEDIVKNNIFDLSDDGYYEYVAIMKVDEGLYSPSQLEYWYH